MIKKIMLLNIFVLMAVPAIGEYYQYTDQYGNLRFTDDLSTVPQSKRKHIKTFESVQSLAVPEPAEAKSTSVPKSAAENSPSAEGSTKANLYHSGKELFQKGDELRNTAAFLREEQAKLDETKPGRNATLSERTAHSEKVKALNEKIKEYNKNRDVHNREVEAFNKQLGYEKARKNK